MRAGTIKAYAAALAVTLPFALLVQPGPAVAAPAAGPRLVATTVTADALAAGRARFGARVSAHEAITAYWTADRMRAARPVEESAAYRDALRREAQRSGPAAPAAARRVPPVNVAPMAGAMGSPSSTDIPAALNPNLAANHPTARTSGKVFFTMAGGNFSCSATVVNSTGLNTVWTAGHCVHGGAGGSLASNWQFVPAYDDDLADREPFDRWTARELWTWSTWADSSDFSADMGVAIMNTRGGVSIVSQYGGQGFRTNQGTSVAVNAFGYPAEAPFDGGNLMRCSSTSTQHANQVLRIACDMTRGSSGGGWLINWDGNWGYLNGVNSTINAIVGPTQMRTPYFDGTAAELYEFTRTH